MKPLGLVNEMITLKNADGSKAWKKILKVEAMEVNCVTFTYQQHPARLILAGIS